MTRVVVRNANQHSMLSGAEEFSKQSYGLDFHSEVRFVSRCGESVNEFGSRSATRTHPIRHSPLCGGSRAMRRTAPRILMMRSLIAKRPVSVPSNLPISAHAAATLTNYRDSSAIEGSSHARMEYMVRAERDSRRGITRQFLIELKRPATLVRGFLGVVFDRQLSKKNFNYASIFLDTEFHQIYTFVSCKFNCCSIDV